MSALRAECPWCGRQVLCVVTVPFREHNAFGTVDSPGISKCEGSGRQPEEYASARATTPHPHQDVSA